MMEKIILVICYILMFFVFNGMICRYNACYFPESLFKKYIIIKNQIVKTLLIGKAVGRNRIVDYHDENKLPVVGLISYVTFAPLNLLNSILKIMALFNYNGIANLKKIALNVENMLTALGLLYFIIFFINICVIDHRRKVKKC